MTNKEFFLLYASNNSINLRKIDNVTYEYCHYLSSTACSEKCNMWRYCNYNNIYYTLMYAIPSITHDEFQSLKLSNPELFI